MKFSLGLDLGNQNFHLVLASQTKNLRPKILAVIEMPASGLSKGSIIDPDDFIQSLRSAIAQLKVAYKHLPKSVSISVSGPHFSIRSSKGVIAVARGDGEISGLDIEQVMNRAKDINITPNKMILHSIPREYTVDELSGIKDPIGMHGIKLEVDSVIIEGFAPNIRTITKCLAELNLKSKDIIFSPLASACSSLSKKQEEVGTALIDLGAERTNFIVFEDGKILTANTFPIGANHITHDIAICLKTSLEIAEKIKLTFGSAISNEVSRKENIDLSKVSPEFDHEISKRYLAEIIEARLEEIFDFINDELKKINRQAKLPGGVILVGGGAKIPQIVEFSKNYLRLPARIGHPVNLEPEETSEELLEIIDDPSYAVANGLCLWGLNSMTSDKFHLSGSFLSKLKRIVKIFVP